MLDLLVRSARLLDGTPDESVDIAIDGGRVVAIGPGAAETEARTVVDADGGLVTPPFVEPRVHLDAALTAGQPRWNASGTLWEGIACWTERRPMLTHEDVISRVMRVLQW